MDNNVLLLCFSTMLSTPIQGLGTEDIYNKWHKMSRKVVKE